MDRLPGQDIGHAEVRLGGMEGLVDGGDEGEILRCVHGPAPGLGRGLPHPADAEQLRMSVEIGGHMFVLIGCGGGGTGPVEGRALDHLHVEALGKRPVGGVVGVVIAARDMVVDHPVDHVRVRQRAVAGQPQEGRRGPMGGQGPLEPGHHVVQRAAEHRNAQRLHIGGQDVVLRPGAGGQHQAVQPPGPAQALDLAADHRLAQDRPQDLAGQSRGAHPRLQYRQHAEIRLQNRRSASANG